MKQLLGIITVTLSIVACKQNVQTKVPPPPSVVVPVAKKTLLGTWRLANVEHLQKVRPINDDALLETSALNEMAQKGMLLSFYPNETYTVFKGTDSMVTGTFKIIKPIKKVVLTNDNKSVDSLKYQLVQNNEKSFLIIEDVKANLALQFVNETAVGDNYNEEPYLGINNEWRYKATKPESPAELQTRLGNYFKHVAYILKTADDKKLEKVSFEFSEGILKIYDGGIGICSVDEIPTSWQNCFYNKKQALTAYNMYNTYLKNSKRYKGSSTGNWIKDDFNVLTSIYGALKAGEFPLQVQLPEVATQ